MSFSCHTDSFVSSSVWNRILHVFPYYDLWDFLSCLAVPHDKEMYLRICTIRIVLQGIFITPLHSEPLV